MAFLILYYSLIKIFSVLFRMVRIRKNKAKFQVISLLTNSRYTTNELEIIVSNYIRRKIAMDCIITGYTFFNNYFFNC